MKSVWIVMTDYYNGEFSEDRFDSVWASQASAQKFCDEMNEKRTSEYSSRYFVFDEEQEVRD